MRIALVLATCIVVTLAPDAVGATSKDTTAAGLRLTIVPKPEAFYSATRGWGAGVDVSLANLGWPGSRVQATAMTMTRHGEYGVAFFSGDPRRAPRFAGGGLHYIGTEAHTFYGTGPRSHRDDALRFSMRRIEGEARLGWRPADASPITLQPFLRIEYVLTRSVEEVEDGALTRLPEADREAIFRALDRSSTGIVSGIAAVWDRLDDPVYPASGTLVQTALQGYYEFGQRGSRSVRGTSIGHVATTVHGERTVAEARLLLVITREVGGGGPVPFYALPTIDGEIAAGMPRHRLVGHDALVASAGLRFPVLELFDWVRADGHIAVHLANTYDDLLRQFEPGVSFATHLDREGARAPLRPSVTVGGHVVRLGEHRPWVSGQVGLSPEGWVLAGLDFVIDLRTWRPPVR